MMLLFDLADHHRHHYNYTFYTSPFGTAVLVTLDNIGADGQHFVVRRAARGVGCFKPLFSCGHCYIGPMYPIVRKHRGVHGQAVTRAAATPTSDLKYLMLLQ